MHSFFLFPKKKHNAENFGGLALPSLAFGRKVLASCEAKSGWSIFLNLSHSFLSLSVWKMAQHDWNIVYRAIKAQLKQNAFVCLLAWYGVLWPSQHLRSCQAGQLTYLHFSLAGSVLKTVNQYFFAHTFTSNWQLPFLNQLKGENVHRNDFLISHSESYVVELGFKLVTLGSAVRCADDCAMETSSNIIQLTLVISTSPISNNHSSRSENLVPA